MRPSLALQTHRDAIRAIALIHRVTHVRVDFGQTQHEQRVRQPSSGVSLKNRMETDIFRIICAMNPSPCGVFPQTLPNKGCPLPVISKSFDLQSVEWRHVTQGPSA